MRNKEERFFYRQNKKGWRFARNLIYNRVIFISLLILVQVALVVGFAFWGLQYIEVYFGSSILLRIIFFIYLVNCPGKNEFKLAWLLPVFIAPVIGITLYIFYHANTSGRSFGKKLTNVKLITNTYLTENSETKELSANFPERADLIRYMNFLEADPPYSKTRVDYYPNGESFEESLLKELENAKHFIFIEFFIISADESWLKIVEILKEKVKQGVEVRVLYDAIGSVFSATKTHQKYLEKAGIKAKIFLPLAPVFATQQNNRDHRKIVVIDGKTAYTGGINISSEYFNREHKRFKYWKDTAVKIKGPAIKTFTTMFLQNWNLISKETDEYEKYINLPYSCYEKYNGLVIPYGDDAYNNEDYAENTYLYMISHAKKYVHITTPYVIIDNMMMNALIFAAKRGVEVSIIVPSKPDHFVTFCIGRTFLKTLIEAGIHIYNYDEGFIHAKNVICDGTSATVGAVNLDYRSFYHHFECGLYMYKCDVINKIEKDFQDTLCQCSEMTVHSYKKLSLPVRFIGRVMRVFAPLM